MWYHRHQLAHGSDELREGRLSYTSVLGQRSVGVAQIASLRPVRLPVEASRWWGRLPGKGAVFEVVAKDGPTGIWLNRAIYGSDPVDALIRTIGMHGGPS